MTGVTSRPPPEEHQGGRGRVPLPRRPTLTTLPQQQAPSAVESQRQVLAAQPWLGLGGLVLAMVVFFALALGVAGSTASSLYVLGPIATFGLPGVAMVAFWWNDWPGSRLSAPWTGLLDTVLIMTLAVALTIAGQAVVERPDIRAVFEAFPGPGAPTTFPATMALAGATFVVMLQIVLVCERWPLAGLKRLWSGTAALALSWAIGAGAYLLFVNVSYLPAAERIAGGLRNPGGPITRADFGSALIAVGIWQALIFIALRGWPVNTIGRRSVRLLAGNAAVIGLGTATYAVLRDGAGLSSALVGAICGCAIGAVLVVAMLFQGWPAALLRPAAGRAVTVALAAAVTVAIYYALAAYADNVHWPRGTAADWITGATLSFAGAGIILHVAVGLRWPFGTTTRKNG